MKKVLAFILSLVLVFTLVTVVACNKEPGGGKFTEVDLTDATKREEFVNALAEKIDLEKLVGDPTKEGWTYGIEGEISEKFDFDLAVTYDKTEYTGKGNLTLTESAKATLKSNGADKDPDFAASMKVGAKGKIDLSETVYTMLAELSKEMGIEGFELDKTVKDAIGSKFDYSAEGYVDKEAALISISDSAYGKLPKFITDQLGSSKIKLPFGAEAPAARAAAEESKGGLPELKPEDVKKAINTVIDGYILPYKVSVAVATKNGYALKLSVGKDSVMAVLNSLPAMMGETQEPAWLTMAKQEIEKSLDKDSKLELIVRVDKEGAFANIELNANIKANLDLTIEEMVAVKGTVGMEYSVKLSKFTGTVKKPSGEFKEFKGIDHNEDYAE